MMKGRLDYDAYGIDVIDCEILDEEHFHKIGFDPYVIPFAGLIQGKGWLKLWARLGVRNEFKNDLSWQEVADRNIGYCRYGINYMSYHKFKEIIKIVRWRSSIG